MNGRRMLVVEDDARSRRAMEALFRHRGWQVLAASTLAEGLALLEPPPDCIVLDLMLPDGEGEAILRKVREENLPTRVAVTTGCHDLSRLSAVADLNPAALLCKPIDPGEVCRAFR